VPLYASARTSPLLQECLCILHFQSLSISSAAKLKQFRIAVACLLRIAGKQLAESPNFQEGVRTSNGTASPNTSMPSWAIWK
jgi:hypothetical protein